MLAIILLATPLLATLATAQTVDNSGYPACTEAGYDCVHGTCIDKVSQQRCDPAKEAIVDTVPSEEVAYFWAHDTQTIIGDKRPADLLREVLWDSCTYVECAHGDQEGSTRCVDVQRWSGDPSNAVNWQACVKVNDWTNKADAGDDSTILWKTAVEAFTAMVEELTGQYQYDIVADIDTYGNNVWEPRWQYSIPKQLDYRQYTKWGSALTLSLSFISEQDQSDCDAVAKAGAVATGITMLGKIPGLSVLGLAGIPFKFASFVMGCEAIKPPGWPKENEP